MKRELSRLAIYGALLCASASYGSLAQAQMPPAINPPPIRSPVDGNMVNLATGGLEVSATQLVIGSPGASGLAHVRYWTGNGWVHGFFMTLSMTATSATVSIGNSSTTFTLSGGTYLPDQANGASLVSNASSYVYTASDGTITTFDKSNAGTVYYSDAVGGLPATSVALPSGELIALTYGRYSIAAPGGGSVTILRLQSVTSTTGYQLKYSYTGTYNPVISQVTAINNAVDYCDPAADSCSFTQSWPVVSYATTASGSNTFESVTDSLGRVTRYTTNASQQLIGIERPGSSSDDETIAYDANGRVSSVTRNGMAWGYAWLLSGATLTATITDPLSHTRVTTADVNKLFVLTDKDENGNTTTYTPDAYGRLQTAKAPVGNSVTYTYDSRGNVTMTQNVAAGSTSASCVSTSNATCLVSTTLYPTTFTNALTYNKPTSATDARGDTTSYAYDSTTGFVTSVTSPTVGGVAPQMRYGYTPLYAYYKNSAGTIVAAASPISKPTSVSTCRTTASCTGGADETRTTIAYGTTGVANTLLPTSTTIAAGDGSLSAVTSAAYDIFGNRAATTDANGQTTLYRYDADRALTGANGPDPDGSGPLKSRAVAIHYLASGLADSVAQGTSNADGSGFAALRTVVAQYDAADRDVQDSLQAGGTTYAVIQRNYDGGGQLDCTVQRMNPAVYGSLPSPTTACTPGTAGSYGPDRIVNEDHDPAGRLSIVVAGFGATPSATTTYGYTANGRLATIRDANGNLTSYGYDGFDRPVKTNYPSPTTPGTSSATDYEQLTLDYNGNVTGRRLRDGTSIGYGYDALDRLTTKTPPSGEYPVGYSYDNLGEPVQISRPGDGSTLGYGHDALGRLTSETQPFGSVAYQYDAAGDRTRLTWQDGQYVSYGYDNVGEMTTIDEGASTLLASYGYDDLGRRVSRTLGNGTSTSYGYDGASRLTSLALAGGTTPPR